MLPPRENCGCRSVSQAALDIAQSSGLPAVAVLVPPATSADDPTLVARMRIVDGMVGWWGGVWGIGWILSLTALHLLLTTHQSLLSIHYSPLKAHLSPITSQPTEPPLTTHHSPLTTHHSPLHSCPGNRTARVVRFGRAHKKNRHAGLSG